MSNIGLLLQCGGNGERFIPIEIPKPIFPLSWEKETCLENILESTPYAVPIFMHIQAEQKEKYDEFIKEHDIKKDIFYIYQEERAVYDIKGEALVENGKVLKSANGPGSFRYGLKELNEKREHRIEYFAVYDGCKTGICWDDVENGAESLIADDKGVFCYVRKLSNGQIEKEKINRRYDIVLNGSVYDKRYSPSGIFENPEAKAVTGLSIFNYRKFIENTQNLEGEMKTYQLNKQPAYYYDFRITHLINSFDVSDRIFADHPEEHYYPSMKLPSDFEKYWKFKERRK
ncbi:hypothetical protein GF361_01235 [Candidatus Woesearchaeota archaeon]|nr:hypothetical protein [Candidatus Woesearchaeota archaeon]